MNKSEKDVHLKLMCMQLSAEMEIHLEPNVDITRLMVRANDIYNQACKYGYMDLVSPYKEPVADLNLNLKKKLGLEGKDKPTTPEQKEVTKTEQKKSYKKKEPKEVPFTTGESPVKAPDGGPIPQGMKACPKCGEWIPETWKNHAYKTNGERCGHNI
jgi:hypothetical protein